MSYLRELLTDSQTVIFELYEDKDFPGVIKGRGPFGKCDRPTANGRVYPRPIMEREVAKLQPAIKARKLKGELDHPGDGKTKLTRVSHIITELSIGEDGIITGGLEVLPTHNGQDLSALIGARVPVDVSSRGFGSVKLSEEKLPDGRPLQIVQSDYSLKTWDCVDEGAAGEFAEPVYTKEGVDETGNPIILPVVETAEDPDLELNGMKEAQQVLITRNEFLESEITRLNLEIGQHVEEDTALTLKMLTFAGAAKRAGYELFTEKTLRGVTSEVREEVLGLIGDVSLFEDLASLSTKLKEVIEKIKAKIVMAPVPAVKPKVVENIVSTKRDLLASKIAERKSGRTERAPVPALTVENEDPLPYGENSALQNYAGSLAMKSGITAGELELLEVAMIEELVDSEEEVYGTLDNFLKDRGRKTQIKKDVSHKNGLFEDVQRRLKANKNLSLTEEVVGNVGENNRVPSKKGTDVCGVSMEELIRISDESRKK